MLRKPIAFIVHSKHTLPLMFLNTETLLHLYLGSVLCSIVTVEFFKVRNFSRYLGFKQRVWCAKFGVTGLWHCVVWTFDITLRLMTCTLIQWQSMMCRFVVSISWFILKKLQIKNSKMEDRYLTVVLHRLPWSIKGNAGNVYKNSWSHCFQFIIHRWSKHSVLHNLNSWWNTVKWTKFQRIYTTMYTLYKYMKYLFKQPNIFQLILMHVPSIFYYFVLWPTNAQLSHKLSHCYMFQHCRVILSQLVINTLPSYTSIPNAAVGNTIYS